MRSAVPPSAATTPPPTCCRRPCARSWGEHVHQAGSYQDDQITHFDFTHFSAVSPAELAEVERRVNEKIYEALPVTVKNLPIEESQEDGRYGSVR